MLVLVVLLKVALLQDFGRPKMATVPLLDGNNLEVLPLLSGFHLEALPLLEGHNLEVLPLLDGHNLVISTFRRTTSTSI